MKTTQKPTKFTQKSHKNPIKPPPSQTRDDRPYRPSHPDPDVLGDVPGEGREELRVGGWGVAVGGVAVVQVDSLGDGGHFGGKMNEIGAVLSELWQFI
jgi:hypothetical protein